MHFNVIKSCQLIHCIEIPIDNAIKDREYIEYLNIKGTGSEISCGSNVINNRLQR